MAKPLLSVDHAKRRSHRRRSGRGARATLAGRRTCRGLGRPAGRVLLPSGPRYPRVQFRDPLRSAIWPSGSRSFARLCGHLWTSSRTRRLGDESSRCHPGDGRGSRDGHPWPSGHAHRWGAWHRTGLAVFQCAALRALASDTGRSHRASTLRRTRHSSHAARVHPLPAVLPHRVLAQKQEWLGAAADDLRPGPPSAAAPRVGAGRG